MNNLKNLQQASATFFFLFGFLYIVAAYFLRNSYMGDYALFYMRLADMPFLFVSLLYGGSTLLLSLGEPKEEGSPWVTIVFATCLVIFGLAVFMNFGFPSSI